MPLLGMFVESQLLLDVLCWSSWSCVTTWNLLLLFFFVNKIREEWTQPGAQSCYPWRSGGLDPMVGVAMGAVERGGRRR